MINFRCIYIGRFNITFITMFILYYSNQSLHVTTHRVCCISISSTNVIMCVCHSILQLVILIKSWTTQTEKFLSPALPP